MGCERKTHYEVPLNRTTTLLLPRCPSCGAKWFSLSCKDPFHSPLRRKPHG